MTEYPFDEFPSGVRTEREASLIQEVGNLTRDLREAERFVTKLRLALGDCVAVFDEELAPGQQTLVTQERRKAWEAVLAKTVLPKPAREGGWLS